MSKDETIQVLLSGRAGVYRLLQNVLGNEPSEELLDQLRSDSVKEVLALFEDGQSEYEQAVSSFIAKAEECTKNSSEAVDMLSTNFTRLFVGPGKVEAPPWESFYLDDEHTLFQHITLSVRKAYVAEELIPQAYPHVSDDHIGLELDFLANLAGRAERAWASGDTATAKQALLASGDFLEQHLLLWAPEFLAELTLAKHVYFYQEAASLLVAFLLIDREAIQEVLGTVSS